MTPGLAHAIHESDDEIAQRRAVIAANWDKSDAEFLYAVTLFDEQRHPNQEIAG